MTAVHPRASHDARAAVGFFTRIPVGSLAARPIRPAWVLAFGPLVGLLLGLAALAVLAVARLAVSGPTGTWVGAVAALAALAYLTRGLHLDGLADMADGLGANRPPQESVSVMQRSDVGAFGVVAVVFALMLQTALLAGLSAGGAAAAALLVAVPASRLAAMWLCGRRSVAAPGSQLGAWVVGTVPRTGAAIAALAVAAGAGLVTHWVSAAALAGPAAVLAALAAGAGVAAIAKRRFAGITGDVLGTAVEAAQTTALLALAVLLL